MSAEIKSDRERLCEIVEQFPSRRVVVVGDLVADQFLYGRISRVSREAPVLILRHERTETTPGGAANCAVNLSSLGARASLVGLVGDDEPGSALKRKLVAAGVECEAVVTLQGLQTTTKVRVLAGQTHSTRQQVIRIDYESEPLAEEKVREELRARFLATVRDADAVVISDYNYGVADEAMVEVIRKATAQRGVPVLVDSRFRLQRFPNFTSATPNEDEVEHLFGEQLTEDRRLEDAGAALLEALGYNSLLVTRGGRGMMLLERGREPLHMEAVGSREPVDGTGAGDTVIATYALALSSGASFTDAARLANHAGGIVVMKRGTATADREELLSSLRRLEAEGGRLDR